MSPSIHSLHKEKYLNESELFMLEKERTFNATGAITTFLAKVARFYEFPPVSCQTFWGGIHAWSLIKE